MSYAAYRRAIAKAKLRNPYVGRVFKVRGHDTGTTRVDEMGEPIVLLATCGACGRSWDDALITSVTPAPSARCPFEDKHTDRGVS